MVCNNYGSTLLDFWGDSRMNIQDILFIVISVIMGTIALALFGIVFGLLYKGIDRKISAHMQGRIGPPIIQPFRDVRKLFTKENIVPENAIPWIFNLAPVIGLIASIALLLYVPIGGFDPLASGLIGSSIVFGDLILILYLLIIPSLAMVIGGFASGSPYATVGAQREMATMIAYEFPLAIIIVSFAWLLGNSTVGESLPHVFSITTITANPIWMSVGILGFIGAIILLLVLVLVTPAELSKIPFDSPEAETEIAGGLFTEYSGRNLGLFYLADGVKTIVMATIVVALFFPWTFSDLIPVLQDTAWLAIIANILFYLLKIFLVILFSVTLIRVAIARLKIDQIVYTYWVWITLMALVGLILIMWDRQFGLQTIASIMGLT